MKTYQVRAIYRVRSRNLQVAVCTDGEHFIGIREKFGSRFLDTEGINGPGYVHVIDPRPIGFVPKEYSLAERGSSECSLCHGEAHWTGPPAPAPWVCSGGCENPCPVLLPNQQLTDLLIPLDEIERKRRVEEYEKDRLK